MNVMKLMAVALAGWINRQQQDGSALGVCFATTGKRHETDDSNFWTLRGLRFQVTFLWPK